MNTRFVLFLSLFLVIFFFRLDQVGGLDGSFNEPSFSPFLSKFEAIGQNLAQKTQQILPSPQAQLLSGILLGVKQDLPADFNNDLKKTSTIHIVVVSGQNLTMVAGFVMSLSRYLGRRKSQCVALLAILFYMLLTGLQIPVIRAAIMVGLASVASLFGREKLSPWILSLTVALMLIYNPSWLLSISFQLSVLATVGVVIVAPEVIKRLKFIPNIFREDLAISIAAQALTWPIIALNFHQMSLIGILVNSLILWTVPIIMVFGSVAVLASLFSNLLGWVFGLIPGVVLTYFIYIVNFFASLPYASVYFPKVSILIWVGYYILILGIFLYLRQSNKSVETKID